MTGDADLEADLGIDSLKRSEMLGKVTAQFGLADMADDVRFLVQPTLVELAELIVTVRHEQAVTVAVDPTPPAVAPGPSTVPDTDSVLEQLCALYASTLGYPLEAVTGDADLEADLGIDSLKRSEMLGKVTAQFGLADMADDVRFLVQPTLVELAELIVTVRTVGR
ncbi:phosphopantetheine-binding protein [Nocardia sp. NPDC051570]|uniref:phosphopantetheine-binding protein n=1 Tax=Nocardia sp. NPDC051570 TaxID=3364324 RepID=UPI0037A66827